MPDVRSKDGTTISYSQTGHGPPLILVDGAFCSRSFGPMPKLVPLLAPHFTVISYDRRGRGASGDTQPYAAEREVEDLQALAGMVGGPVSLYGASSGAVLALRAAVSGIDVTRLVLFEPPVVLAGSPPPVPPDHMGRIAEMVAAGRRGDAVKTFMRMVGTPAIFIPLMRIMPGVWSKLTGVAHTLPYDFAVLDNGGAGQPLSAELRRMMASIKAPTLMLVGGKSPGWMFHAVQTFADNIPGAAHRVLPGQNHNAAATAIAPVLVEFLGAERHVEIAGAHST